MTDEQKRQLYLKYRTEGYSHLDAVRKVLADERLPSFIETLTTI